MEKELQQAIKKGIEIAEQTGTFVIEQAPELLQEFYRWHIVKYVMFILIMVVISFTVIFLARLFGEEKSRYTDLKLLGKWYDTENPKGILVIMSLVISFLFSIIVFLDAIFNLVKLTIAPKIYLIEYFLN